MFLFGTVSSDSGGIEAPQTNGKLNYFLTVSDVGEGESSQPEYGSVRDQCNDRSDVARTRSRGETETQ